MSDMKTSDVFGHFLLSRRLFHLDGLYLIFKIVNKSVGALLNYRRLYTMREETNAMLMFDSPSCVFPLDLRLTS